jgi:Tol biopolymer transport system component
MAQSLEAGAEKLSGEARSIARTVAFVPWGAMRADISASRNGTLVYLESDIHQRQLTWVDRQGKPVGTIGQPDNSVGVRIFPDGSRIAVAGINSSGAIGVALVEANRGVATPFATGFGGVWSPDGGRVVYSGDVSGAPNLYSKPAHGAGEAERLTHSKGSQMVYDWSADGRYLLYRER